MVGIPTALCLASLTLLPGAWISFGRPGAALSFSLRVVLGILLSPLIMALEYAALKSLGFSFAHVARIIFWMALTGIVPVIYDLIHRSKTRVNAGSVLAGAVLYVALAILALSPELMEPAFGVFGRHAFLHSDIGYQLEKDGVWPEEPQLAGVRLSYPWLSHVHWAVLGWSCDLSPALVDTLTNLIYLACMCVCGYEASRLLGVHPLVAWFGVSLMILGTNALGQPVHLLKNLLTGGTVGFLTGDPRYTPLLIKFTTPNQMPLALGLLAGLIVAVTSLAQRPRASSTLLPIALLLGMGLMYPPIYPAGFVLAAGPVLLWELAPQRGDRPPGRRRFVLGAGILAATVCIVGYLQWICVDRTRSTLHLAGIGEMIRQAMIILVVFGPLLIPALWAGRGRTTSERLVITILALAVLISTTCCVILSLDGGNEYKFILAGAVLLGPLTAAGLDGWLASRPRVTLGLAAAATVILGLITVHRVRVFLPRGLDEAPKVAPDGYVLKLDEGERHAGWTQAVRTQTPANTLVASRTYPAHVPAFTSRTMYVAQESLGPVAGYGLPVEDNLLRIRGYDESMYRGRVRTLANLFTGRDANEWRRAVEEIRSLRRPVAVILEAGPDAEALRLFRSEPGAELLWTDSQFSVYLLPPNG